jgi:hypothetical protein
MAQVSHGKWSPLQLMIQSENGDEQFGNRQYTVVRRQLEPDKGLAGPLWLRVNRNDFKAIRDWRDLQRVKNELVGGEREAVELFPAESRRVDAENTFHLWVLPADEQFDIGFRGMRLVLDASPFGSHRQRALQ